MTAADSALSRYRDAYAVARVTNGVGSFVKILAFIVGGIMLLIYFAALNAASQYQGFGPTQPVGAAQLVALFPILGIAAGIYISGVFICAFAQMLAADLDSAVHSSPFLDERGKATAMSLPYPPE